VKYSAVPIPTVERAKAVMPKARFKRSSIRLEEGRNESAELSERGDLVIGIGEMKLTMLKPVTYQEVNGARRQIESNYTIRNPQSAIRNPQSVLSLAITITTCRW
jgi:hypothetical protein